MDVNIGENSSSSSHNDDHDDRHQALYQLELVLRKWFAIDPSREMRAFVREGVLIGASFVAFLPSSIIIYIYTYILSFFVKGQVYRSVVIRTITSF